MHYRHGRKEQPAACRLEKTPGGCDLIKKQTDGGGGGEFQETERQKFSDAMPQSSKGGAVHTKRASQSFMKAGAGTSCRRELWRSKSSPTRQK